MSSTKNQEKAPEVDVNSGKIINPHNPDFITKKPWYLGEDSGPTLDHQASTATDSKGALSLSQANHLLEIQRSKIKHLVKSKKFKVGMWVEALKRNKMPYQICQIIRIGKKGTEFDIRFEDGYVEKNIKMKKSERGYKNARIRFTKAGNRAVVLGQGDEDVGLETYDSKRDKYHGFEVDSHQIALTEKYEEREALRKRMRAEQQKKKEEEKKKGLTDTQKTTSDGNDSDSDYDSDRNDSDSDDEFVLRDTDAKVHTSRLARQGGVGGAQMKVTARNLRIREDTAKYLRNLDANSAYYDPKSRSMRDNPNPELDPSEVPFAGDNFARISGDAVGLAQTQVFAWDMSGKSSGVGEISAATSAIHPQANPSQAELMKKRFTEESKNLKVTQKKSVLDKYGGEEYLDGKGGLASVVAHDTEKGSLERQARFGVATKEEIFTRDGNKIGKGAGKAYLNLKSKYEEDIFINGHTTVWGSYFHKGAFRWGYADDHSLMRNSYCTGMNGRIANDEANNMKYGTGEAGSAALAQAREMLKAIPKGISDQARLSASRPTNSKLYGEADQFKEIDKEKLKAALEKEGMQSNDEKTDSNIKRKYNSIDANVNVTEEDMEVYRLKKGRANDPMANFSSEELLEYKG
jgi:pre-mRNA-processing factor SLU7